MQARCDDVEVAITVHQGGTVAYRNRGDQAVKQLANGLTATPHGPVEGCRIAVVQSGVDPQHR